MCVDDDDGGVVAVYIQDRSSIGEKTRVTDSPRITSGKRFSAPRFIRRSGVLCLNLIELKWHNDVYFRPESLE